MAWSKLELILNREDLIEKLFALLALNQQRFASKTCLLDEACMLATSRLVIRIYQSLHRSDVVGSQQSEFTAKFISIFQVSFDHLYLHSLVLLSISILKNESFIDMLAWVTNENTRVDLNTLAYQILFELNKISETPSIRYTFPFEM